jgi:hypothetical protein
MNIMDDLNLDLVAAQPFNTYYSPEYYKDYFKFAFVRNPYDRLVSGWYNKVVKKEVIKLKKAKRENLLDFNAFVEYLTTWDLKTCDIHFRLQSLLIDMNEVDYIGRMESFEEDLRQVFHILGLQVKKIPHSNKSNNRQDYKSYYNKVTQQKVEQMYRKDLQLFGYSF